MPVPYPLLEGREPLRAAPYRHPLAENVAPLVGKLADGYSHVLAAATTVGKNILPRVAAALDSVTVAK